jgi:serine protease inhibitor
MTASNAFGIELYRALCKEAPEKNLFVSPYSMSIALTMAAEGARGETEEEMAGVLHFPPSGEAEPRGVTAVHRAYADLARHFREAAGNSDPETRERIERLRRQLADAKQRMQATPVRTLAQIVARKQLDDASRRAQQIEEQQERQDFHKARDVEAKTANELNKLLPTVDRFDLRIANALWVERTFPLVPDYVRTIEQFYGAGAATPLDLIGEREKSRLRINEWVEANTEQRIQNLIPAGALAQDARLVITNAVYFKGQWTEPFPDEATKDEDFTRADGTKHTVKRMRDRWRDSVPYAAFSANGDYFATPREVPRNDADRPQTYPDDGGFTMVELAYKGDALSMVVIAPRVASGLPALESRLSAASLSSWIQRLERRAVDTAIPRFKMQSEHEMTATLQAMGMKRAFVNPEQSGGAQFPGISDSEDPEQQLFIGAIHHKAWVEVTEQGTEAAAATALAVAYFCAMGEPVEMVPFIPKFHADHPFLFLIRDTKTDTILFMGRVMDPDA